MTRKKDSEEVMRRMNRHVRQVNHGMSYYLALFLLTFAIPLYALLQFFYIDANGWTLFDMLFVLALGAIAIYGIYVEFAPKIALPVWFTVLGVTCGIVVTLIVTFIR